MPRLTRAAARANLAFYEGAASIPLPETPNKSRRPLGEVSGNTPPKPHESEPKEEVQSTPSKGIRTEPAVGRIVLRKDTDSSPSFRARIINEDDELGTSSSASSEVCQSLRKESSG